MKPFYTTAQIADRVAYGPDGYRSGNWHRFELGADRTLTVDLTNVNDEFADYARAALQLWTDTADITFREVRANADITFFNPFFGEDFDSAYAQPDSFRQTIFSVDIVIGQGFYAGSSEEYRKGTFVHEIGHALGLEHPGEYNGTANYVRDAEFANDSWQATIMSYFDQEENPAVEADFANPLTPMAADIVAIRQLYGAGDGVRLGDTVYGYGSNAGPDFGAASIDTKGQPVSFTIVDDGGIDTINALRATVDTTIDLRAAPLGGDPAAHASSFGSINGNMIIAPGTVIERAFAGRGDDTLFGNQATNLLWGGAGDDLFVLAGGAANLVKGAAGDDTVRYADSVALGADDLARFGATTLAFTAKGTADRLLGIETVEAGGAEFAVVDLGYVGPWSYLASRSFLIDSFGADLGIAERHYVLRGHDSTAAADLFDEWSYIASRPHLVDWLGTNGARGELAARHYVLNVHEKGAPVDAFDEWTYLASNDDLIPYYEAIADPSTIAARHYVVHGIARDRPTDEFDAAQYMANYSDLARAEAWDDTDAARHYVIEGFALGYTDDPLLA